MGKYVTKKHGIMIGYQRDGFGLIQDGKVEPFSCIISFDHYDYVDYFSTIKTPAQQMFWVTNYRLETPELKSWAQRWLDKECPGWAIRVDGSNPIDYTIFLQKRSHAIKIFKFLDEKIKLLKFKS